MRPKPAQAPGYIDEPIAMVRSWGTTSDTLWYLQGNNYNVEALTDRTGAIVERYAYTPYGEPTVYTAAGTDGKWFTTDDVTASVSAKGNALTFQGRELDAETGVYYFRNRYYSAQMGRFVSRDPIRLDAADLNFFRIEGNRTIGNVDPLGLYDGKMNATAEETIKAGVLKNQPKFNCVDAALLKEFVTSLRIELSDDEFTTLAGCKVNPFCNMEKKSNAIGTEVSERLFKKNAALKKKLKEAIDACDDKCEAGKPK